MRAAIAVPLALLTLGCGSLHTKLDKDVPAPRELAILPLAGDASLMDRELVRAMLKERLAVRYFAVLDNAWVDRVLAERGWLADPEAFDPTRLPLPAVCEALGTQGVVIGTEVGSSTFDIGLFYRRGFGGKLACSTAKGRLWYEGEYAATKTGGVLLKSGQIINAITDHVESGTSRGFIALVDEYLDTVLSALPELPAEGRPERAKGVLSDALVQSIEGELAHVVARGTPGLVVTFDVTPELRHVPSSELKPGEYHALVRLGRDKASLVVVARAKDALGREVGTGTPPLPAVPGGSR